MYDEYAEAVFKVGNEIMALISEELGQPRDFLFSKFGKEKAYERTHFNYYPPCPQPELVLGISGHADGSTLTLLQQNDVSGLEILKDGEWIRVAPPSAHAIVVNIGDSLQARSSTLN